MDRIAMTVDHVAERFPLFIPIFALIGFGAVILLIAGVLMMIASDE